MFQILAAGREENGLVWLMVINLRAVGSSESDMNKSVFTFVLLSFLESISSVESVESWMVNMARKTIGLLRQINLNQQHHHFI